MTYEQMLREIGALRRFADEPETELVRELMHRLGDPQREGVIYHVAGTNGKGSVCAFLERMLRESGFRTGLYTSPHLVRINERFQIDRQEAGDEELAGAYGRVREAVDAMRADGWPEATFFPMLTATALVWFADRRADRTILETGLGGRLDATNVVESPAVSVITSISLDHTECLGSSVAEIAGEKAGIIKPGVPVVYDASDAEAAAVIEQRAKELGSPALPVAPGEIRIVQSSAEGIAFELNNRYYDHELVRIASPAPYQARNCALALTAIRASLAGETLTDEQCIRAAGNTSWAGRMEKIRPGVYLDGAHNEDGIRQLIRTIESMPEKRRVLLFSAVAGKDHEAMIRQLTTQTSFAAVVVTQVGGSRMVPAQQLSQIFETCTQAPVYTCPDVGDAYEQAIRLKGDGGELICAGSLYLVGALKKYSRLSDGQPGQDAMDCRRTCSQTGICSK